MSGKVLRRAGLIGDVHGEADALQVALTFLQADTTLDALLCTGDLPGKQGIGDTERCVALLRDAQVHTIRGNHDRWAFEGKTMRSIMGLATSYSKETSRYLSALPSLIEWETPSGDGLLCHGIGKDDMAGVYPGGKDDDVVRALETYGMAGRYRFVIAGHTHYRLIRPLPTAGITWLNPGTLRYSEHPGLCIADFAAQTAQFHDIDPITKTVTVAGEAHSPALE